MRRTSIAVLAGLAVAGSALAQTPAPRPGKTPPAPTASTVAAPAIAALSRAVGRYTDGGSHSTSFVQMYTPSGFANARTESGTVSIQAPQRVRFDYAAPARRIFTYDSGEGRFLSPEDRQLTVRRLSEDEKARLPVVFLTRPEELGRLYEISVVPAEPGSATRLLLKPRVARPELAWLRLAIEADGSVRELSYQDAGGNRTDFRFQPWRRGKPRPAADFRITGPPGTRIVEN